jgi:6-pyruvoyltetrahydropterin/6-carboxytetrahydropterin synthase
MYEIAVEAEFCAAHALLIGGVREPVHGHNWKVTVVVGGDRLDADGLLVDFHALQGLVTQVLAPFQNADLNAAPAFKALNPSAEHVARHIAEGVGAGLERGGSGTHSAPIKLVFVRVTEAPGCSVVYRP